MSILLRHTVLGQCLRYFGLSRLSYAEEREPYTLKKLTSIQNARAETSEVDEHTALLAEGEREYGARTVLVDWYSDSDDEVCLAKGLW